MGKYLVFETMMKKGERERDFERMILDNFPQVKPVGVYILLKRRQREILREWYLIIPFAQVQPVGVQEYIISKKINQSLN